MGLKLHQSEIYLLTLRHFKKEYNIPPWEWDYEYPEDMKGHYFPEDINGLVGLDVGMANHDKVKSKSVSQY